MTRSDETPFTVKCRYPAGQFTLENLPSSLSFEAFQGYVQERTGIAPSLQVLKTGYPPLPLTLPNDASATVLGGVLRNGDLVMVESRAVDDVTESPDETAPLTENDVPFQSGRFPSLPDSLESSSELTSMSVEGTNGTGPLLTSFSHPDEDIDRAIALSLSEDAPPKEVFQAGPVTRERLENGSYIVRRYVDSDNSCLFTAVAYVMEGNRLRGFDLRSVIAATVRSDPFKYSEAFLGRPNWEYCEWIVNPQHWGGEIELMILSQYYQRQIAAYDIQTTNCYVYGSDAGFSQRAMLVYDGIHYDALALSPYEDAPEELDLTLYDPLSPEGTRITNAAVNLVRRFNETNQFTNTATFQLRCDECGRGFAGSGPAVDHQRVTGHTNFSEYR